MSASPETERERSCVHCQCEINAGATICPHCNSHQSKVKNRLIYASTITGFVTLMASALAYLYSTTKEMVTEAKTSEGIIVENVSAPPLRGVVLNVGLGEVFVSHIQFYSHDGSQSHRIGVTVGPGKFFSIDPPKSTEEVELEDERESAFYLGVPQESRFIEDMPGFLRYVSDGERDCLRERFFGSDQEEFLRMRDHYQSTAEHMVAIKASGVITYFSSRTKGQAQHFKLELVSVYLVRKRCSDLVQARRSGEAISKPASAPSPPRGTPALAPAKARRRN
jgi:hypothetical protein